MRWPTALGVVLVVALPLMTSLNSMADEQTPPQPNGRFMPGDVSGPTVADDALGVDRSGFEVAGVSNRMAMTISIYSGDPEFETELLQHLVKSSDQPPDLVDLLAADRKRLGGARASPATTWEIGRPILPVYRYTFAVPHNADITISTVFDHEKVVPLAHEVLPMQPLEPMTGVGKPARRSGTWSCIRVTACIRNTRPVSSAAVFCAILTSSRWRLFQFDTNPRASP